MSSSLLLQQCPACLVRRTFIVFVMRGKCPYSWSLVGCCRQDLFNTALNILVQFPSSLLSSRFVSVHVVHPYSSIDTTAAWKKLRFILSVRSDFHMIESLSIAVHAFVSRVSMSFSVDTYLGSSVSSTEKDIIYLCYYNPARMAQYRVICIRTKHLESSNEDNKEISRNCK